MLIKDEMTCQGLESILNTLVVQCQAHSMKNNSDHAKRNIFWTRTAK